MYHVFTTPHGGSDRPCPCEQYYRNTGSRFNRSFFRRSRKSSGPWGALRDVDRGARVGAGGAPVALPAWLARATAGRSRGTGASLHREGGIRHHHYPGADRTADYRPPLRRLCGWSSVREVPSEATFSRAFAAFADSALPSRLHEALLEKTMQDHLVGHISRDSTAIEGTRETGPEATAGAAPKRKRGRPRKGEQRPAQPPRRLQRQLEMPLPQMIADLPTACDIGTKRNAKGHQTSWNRLQAAYRRCRRRDSAQLHSDLGLTARQSGRHSPGCHDRATGDQSV